MHVYFCIDSSVINSDSRWFVNFYSALCSHCHHLAPTWKKVARLLDNVVNVAAVNCEYYRQLCYEVGIRSYPTLLYFQKVDIYIPYIYVQRESD